MKVSRCRFWRCAKCQAVVEKTDLATKVWAYSGQVTFLGNATCGQCQAEYAWVDVYAGQHDVPRELWGRLPQPVELPDDEPAAGPGPPSAWESGLTVLGRLFPKSCTRCANLYQPKDSAYYCEKCGTRNWGPTLGTPLLFGALNAASLAGLSQTTSLGWRIALYVAIGWFSLGIVLFLANFIKSTRLAMQYAAKNLGRKKMGR